jgi:hypothetical protein
MVLSTPISLNHNIGTDRVWIHEEVSKNASITGVPTDKTLAWMPPFRGYYYNGSTNQQSGIGWLNRRNQLMLAPGLNFMWGMGDDGNAVDCTHIRATVERSY